MLRSPSAVRPPQRPSYHPSALDRSRGMRSHPFVLPRWALWPTGNGLQFFRSLLLAFITDMTLTIHVQSGRQMASTPSLFPSAQDRQFVVSTCISDAHPPNRQSNLLLFSRRAEARHLKTAWQHFPTPSAMLPALHIVPKHDVTSKIFSGRVAAAAAFCTSPTPKFTRRRMQPSPLFFLPTPLNRSLHQ